MPIIKIYGMPEKLNEREILSELATKIREAITNISALELEPQQISIFMPAEMRSKRQQRDLIVCVEGLFHTEQRTSAVRQKMASAILDVLQIFTNRWWEACKKIEVLIDPPFQPENGFASVTFMD